MSTYISRGSFTDCKDCESEQELTEKVLLVAAILIVSIQ